MVFRRARGRRGGEEPLESRVQDGGPRFLETPRTPRLHSVYPYGIVHIYIYIYIHIDIYMKTPKESYGSLFWPMYILQLHGAFGVCVMFQMHGVGFTPLSYFRSPIQTSSSSSSSSGSSSHNLLGQLAPQ